MVTTGIVPPASWNAAEFRTNIRFAMIMGYALSPADQPVFEFEPVETYPPDAALDLEGKPLDPNVAAVVVTPPPFQFDTTAGYACAVETDLPAIGAFDELEPGVVRRIRAVLTLLDEEWNQLLAAGDPKWVRLGGDRYLILMTLPQIALFDVGVVQLVAGSTEED